MTKLGVRSRSHEADKASGDGRIQLKNELRAEIYQHTREFLARGGKIQKLDNFNQEIKAPQFPYYVGGK